MEDKLNAAIAWLITGDSVSASRVCGVGDRTIRNWMHEPWWDDVLDEAKGIKQKELDAIYTGVLHKTMDQLRSRLDEGDSFVTKIGGIINVPIKAKDLAIIASIITDKRALLRGQATRRTENITIEQRLDKIAERIDAKPITIESKQASNSE